MRTGHQKSDHSRSERGHAWRPCGSLVGLFLAGAAICTPAAGDAEEPTDAGNLPFTDPYAFSERFTDSPDVKALGFPTGPKPFFIVGVVVETEEAEKAGTPLDIASATASNGKVTIDLVHADIGIFELWDNWDDISEFDPDNHTGTWIITLTDSKGASSTTRPVLLDYGFDMPLVEVENIEKTASGDLTVTWSAPDLDPEIVERCDIDYRFRLLQKDIKQFFRSDPMTETSVTVPAAILEEKVGGDLDGVWGRVEMECRDKEQKDADGDGQVEAKSNTFFPLT